jgi:hypothetical protein
MSPAARLPLDAASQRLPASPITRSALRYILPVCASVCASAYTPVLNQPARIGDKTGRNRRGHQRSGSCVEFPAAPVGWSDSPRYTPPRCETACLHIYVRCASQLDSVMELLPVYRTSSAHYFSRLSCSKTHTNTRPRRHIVLGPSLALVGVSVVSTAAAIIARVAGVGGPLVAELHRACLRKRPSASSASIAAPPPLPSPPGGASTRTDDSCKRLQSVAGLLRVAPPIRSGAADSGAQSIHEGAGHPVTHGDARPPAYLKTQPAASRRRRRGWRCLPCIDASSLRRRRRRHGLARVEGRSVRQTRRQQLRHHRRRLLRAAARRVHGHTQRRPPRHARALLLPPAQRQQRQVAPQQLLQQAAVAAQVGRPDLRRGGWFCGETRMEGDLAGGGMAMGQLGLGVPVHTGLPSDGHTQ